MAGTGTKWMVGCGIGCGLMVLIVGSIGTCGYFEVKKFIDQADGMEENFELIETQFGEPKDFVPPADGIIPPERMEVFLAIRDEMAPTRMAASDLLLVLDDGRDANFIDKAKAGMGLVPALLGFIGVRNEVLLSHDMGVGEYQNIYVLSYFILLQKDLADGPSFTLTDSGTEDSDDGVGVKWGISSGSGDVHENRIRRVRSFANELQSELIDNQLEAYRATLPAGTDLADDPWGAQLLAEAAALKDEDLRLPWEEGLPAQTRASLEPYSTRLDQSYDSMTSIIEIGLVDVD